MPRITEAWKMANAELKRRGDTMPTVVELSAHAIDRASLRVRKRWHEDRGQDEGLYSWLTRICDEALQDSNKDGQLNETICWKGCKLIFTYGNYFPTLKTVMPDKTFSVKKDNQNA